MRLVLFATLLAIPCAAAPLSRTAGDGGRGAAACYASTREWRAWIDPKPGAERSELVVAGVVTTPTGGHRTLLTLGPTLRSEPPQQIVNLEIRSQGDIATMMVVTEEVQARFPALPRYGAVVILCNGHEVGRVSPVKTAHHRSEILRPPLRPPPAASYWNEHPARPPVPSPQEGPRGEPPPRTRWGTYGRRKKKIRGAAPGSAGGKAVFSTPTGCIRAAKEC